MADGKKKKSYRKEYLNDFRPDETGKYSYQGEMKTFSEAEKAARKQAGSAASSALLFILAAGFVTGRDLGSRAYVLIPYLIVLGAAGVAVYYVFALGRKDEVRSYVAKRAVPRIIGAASIAFIAAVLTAAGGLASIIAAPGTELVLKISFTALMVGTAADAYFLRQAGKGISFS